ncbi:MAG: Calx-beta domain-containing protein [Nitriliruptorales bacterium]|nr:Calx-beta domain-containing protein [Nitriliruptorales bacterium]
MATSTNHGIRLFVAAVIAVAGSILLAGPAVSACHLAAFLASEAGVGEFDGSVTVTVELQGRQPSCSGTVQYETADGTAAAGADYEAQSGELTFEPSDDRVEDIVITIVDDAEAEGDETFTITLTGADGLGIGSPSTVTITIADDDQPDATAPPTEPDTVDVTEGEPTATEPGDDDATGDTDEPGDTDESDDDDDGSSAVPIILAAVIVVVGLGGLLLARMRRS